MPNYHIYFYSIRKVKSTHLIKTLLMHPVNKNPRTGGEEAGLEREREERLSRVTHILIKSYGLPIAVWLGCYAQHYISLKRIPETALNKGVNKHTMSCKQTQSKNSMRLCMGFFFNWD